MTEHTSGPDPASRPGDRTFAVVVEESPVAVVVHVAGEIDLCTAPSLAAELDGAIARCGAASEVVVDMARVSFLDARGLSALLESHRRATGFRKRLVLAHPSAMVRRMLRVTSLDQVLPLLEDTS